jgi:hypothetical protein
VFSSSEAGSSFECRLDGGAWAACSSPRDYTGLASGPHSFAVRATDPAGNTDTSPASWAWTVNVSPPPDTTAPDTTIGSGPSGTSTSASASFSFSSSEPGSTFQCQLDSGAWAACSSPREYSNLANGPHSFAVRATDATGNTDTSPASRVWTVNVPPPPTGSVTLREPDGGAGYYGRFTSPLPPGPEFFPIGVWGSYDHTQANINLDKSHGLNLYVWPADTGVPIERFATSGMYALLTSDWYGRPGVASSPANVGYMLEDEVDMRYGPSQGYTVMQDANNAAPNDGRARYANYGKGVMFWETDQQAQRFVNEFQTLVSNDIYWFTDPNVCRSMSEGPSFYGTEPAQLTPAQCRRARNYGDTVERMRFLDGLDGERKPIWNFVEVGWPFTETAAQGGRTIAPAEVRAAVWHSVIAGARGIVYFNHSFGGPCITHHALRNSCYMAVRDAVRATSTQLQALAPVLNAPSVTSGFTASSTVRATARWQGGQFWVIAGSSENQSSTGSFSIPCVGNATATVVDEGRIIPVTDGSFTDSFADGNAVHIYRIDGGSNCGLGSG